MRLTTLKLFRLLSNAAASKVDHYANYIPTALTIDRLVEFGRKRNQRASFGFLRNELLVRLGNIIKEIEHLPQRLLLMPSANAVRQTYEGIFESLLPFESSVSEKYNKVVSAKFNLCLNEILEKDADTIKTLAEGLLEYHNAYKVDCATEAMIQYFLDRFYISRISIRLLMSQHVALFDAKTSPEKTDRIVGMIDTECNLLEVITDAYSAAKFLCEHNYQTAPELKLEADKNPIAIAYIASHIHYIMFELFKNAMRAVVELHEKQSFELSDLQVLVMKGPEDVTIKLVDKGGGIPRSQFNRLFNYSYTTAPVPFPRVENVEVPMAGLGYGLPLARLYARYLRGDLKLTSIEGRGTEAYVYLKACSGQAKELLPVYSTKTRSAYKNSPISGDWSH